LKVVNTETNFLSKLKLEVPLTPVSLKKTRPLSDLEQPNDLRDLGKPLIPLSPRSSDPDPGIKLEQLEQEVFDETFTAESSLRLPVPKLPQHVPNKSIFPPSMFGIFIAEDGLGCENIARSVLDTLNDEMKWHPFITKKMRTLDTWPEEVEGDWEDFLDYRGLTYESEIIVLRRVVKREEHELLEAWDFEAANGRQQMIDDELVDVLEAVRKRKSEEHEMGPNKYGRDTNPKRSKWSQKNRIAEFMTLRGLEVPDVDEDEISAKVMIRTFIQVRR
jgi:hypothetical protein